MTSSSEKGDFLVVFKPWKAVEIIEYKDFVDISLLKQIFMLLSFQLISDKEAKKSQKLSDIGFLLRENQCILFLLSDCSQSDAIHGF